MQGNPFTFPDFPPESATPIVAYSPPAERAIQTLAVVVDGQILNLAEFHLVNDYVTPGAAGSLSLYTPEIDDEAEEVRMTPATGNTDGADHTLDFDRFVEDIEHRHIVPVITRDGGDKIPVHPADGGDEETLTFTTTNRFKSESTAISKSNVERGQVVFNTSRGPVDIGTFHGAVVHQLDGPIAVNLEPRLDEKYSLKIDLRIDGEVHTSVKPEELLFYLETMQLTLYNLDGDGVVHFHPDGDVIEDNEYLGQIAL